MSFIICASILLVVSCLFTSCVAGLAAITLSSELSESMSSIYDQSSSDDGYDHSIIKTTSIVTEVEIDPSAVRTAIFAPRPTLSRGVSQASTPPYRPALDRTHMTWPEKMSFGSFSGGAFQVDDYLSASTAAARVFRRRSTVMFEDTGLLFLRC